MTICSHVADQDHREHPWKRTDASFQFFAEHHSDRIRNRTPEFAYHYDRSNTAVCGRAKSFLKCCGVPDTNQAALDTASDWFTYMLESGFQLWDRIRPFYPFGYAVLQKKLWEYLRRDPCFARLDFEPMWTMWSEAENDRHESVVEEVYVLPPEFRRLIILRYYHGLSASRTASELKIPVNVVYRLCHRALRLIESRLEQER